MAKVVLEFMNPVNRATIMTASIMTTQLFKAIYFLGETSYLPENKKQLHYRIKNE